MLSQPGALPGPQLLGSGAWTSAKADGTSAVSMKAPVVTLLLTDAILSAWGLIKDSSTLHR